MTFSPGFRSSIKRIMLFYDPDGLASTLKLFRSGGSLSALETVYIRLEREASNIFLMLPLPTKDQIYQAVERSMKFKLSVQSINNRVGVVLLERATPLRAMVRGKHSEVITINATEYVSIDTSAINTSLLCL